jgi:glycosyltransferase involved in cell wall biosynthesis
MRSKGIVRRAAEVSPDTPVVSVVIPTFHRPVLLARAIASALAQTCDDIEVLVVDDGPSAGASDVVKGAGDARLRYLRHDTTRGAAAARNTGLRDAQSAFVAFLDDDDTWLPTKLARQLERFSDGKRDLGVVYCSSLKYSDISQRVIDESLARPLRQGYVDFLRSTRFGTSVPLIRRNCFDDIGGFDESLPGTQDRDMWIRLAKHFEFDFVPEVLVWHHIHGNQITSNLGQKLEARELLLAKYRADLESHPDIMANYLWRLGMLCCADGRHDKGRRFIWQAIRRQPRLRGAYRDLMQSLVRPGAYQRRLLDDAFRGADGVPFYY